MSFTLIISVVKNTNIHALISSNVRTPSSGRDVINVIQWSQMQDVRHVTMVSRVMGMEVVFHAHLMNVVLKTQHNQQRLIIVLNVMNLGMDVGSVHQGIILMIQLVHV